MIDLNKIEQYRENNRIEAKKALGGLPRSIWETYSAFANTLGGVILLGAEEYRDKSLHVIDLPDPEGMVQDFWALLNDPRVASVNVLSDRNVRIETVNGRRMILITVPRAQRFDRPVYIGNNPLTGTYRRSGEGDYRCTREEVHAMLRDAAVQTPDMTVLEDMGMEVLCAESIRSYRARMRLHRPGHLWEKLEDGEFLYKLGAAGKCADGLHPTAAGLLMFGYEYEIVRRFPDYFLDYQEHMDEAGGMTARILSSSGDWTGNLYDFYFRVYDRIADGIRIPLQMDAWDEDDTPVHRALREALANSLINADYYGRQGVVVVKSRDRITIANPGGFRIGLDEARHGGVSDPRNAALVKMFNLVSVGRRTGSGIPDIYAAWKKQGWALPVIRESFAPERITLSFSVEEQEGRVLSPVPPREAVIIYLTESITATVPELAGLLQTEPAEVQDLLQQMLEDGIIVRDREHSESYRLKA